jgi:hypothetical protein
MSMLPLKGHFFYFLDSRNFGLGLIETKSKCYIVIDLFFFN